MNADSIARLKITLRNVKPSVWRRIEAPFGLRLDRLHLVFQSALGWSDDHLYEIRSGGCGWGMPDPDWADDMLDAKKARLSDVVEEPDDTFLYLYDFGDGWEHTVKLERLIEPEPGMIYPRLVVAAGRCPPEDVGGPWGYAEFLKAIRNPKHRRHVEFREWIEDDFNPNIVPEDELAASVAALAKQWAPKIRAKRARQG